MEFTPDVQATLKIYEALLVKWQKAINIVSPSTIPDAWTRHIIDSAQVSSLISENTQVYADLGCGGGFPGLVVGLMRPELEVHLVESDERKCQFMRTVIRVTGADCIFVHTMRIEESYDEFSPEVISARALAALPKLLGLCAPWIAHNSDVQMLFMKGQRAEEELLEAQKLYDFTYERIRSLTDKQACILRISCGD